MLSGGTSTQIRLTSCLKEECLFMQYKALSSCSTRLWMPQSKILLQKQNLESRSHYWTGEPNMHLLHWLWYLHVWINLQIWLFHGILQLQLVNLFAKWYLCWLSSDGIRVGYSWFRFFIFRFSSWIWWRKVRMLFYVRTHQQPSGDEYLGTDA